METIIKELPSFRLKIKKNPCLHPEGLNNLEFVQEYLDDKGEIDYTSTYQFFMTQDEINDLTKALTA
jgi:hypothetical protein